MWYTSQMQVLGNLTTDYNAGSSPIVPQNTQHSHDTDTTSALIHLNSRISNQIDSSKTPLRGGKKTHLHLMNNFIQLHSTLVRFFISEQLTPISRCWNWPRISGHLRTFEDSTGPWSSQVDTVHKSTIVRLVRFMQIGFYSLHYAEIHKL